MPKWPVVSGEQAIKALEPLGFNRVRQRGSHVVVRQGATGTEVPLHRELEAGTLAGILRQAEVDVVAFIAAID
ncbi:MAG: type II toxin-antitoxin system HicA family toxin [Novosphingobium sp.]